MFARRQSKPVAANSARFVIESLEDRRLLTLLLGGEVFEYRDAFDQLVQIRTSGDMEIDLIGANVLGTGAVLGDLRGQVISSPYGRQGLGAIPATDDPQIETDNLYAIRVNRADLNSWIAIAMIPDPPAPPVMVPFGGAVSFFITDDYSTGQDGQSGSIVLGAVTADNDPNRSGIQADIPIIFANLNGVVGKQEPGQLMPGLYVVGRAMEYLSNRPAPEDRLLQANLDNIRTMAIAQNGQIAVIDVDGVNAAGAPAGDELALVDRISGNAFRGAQVHVRVTQEILRDVQAMSYGDFNGDGIQELYAVYNYNNATTFGQVIDNPDSPEFGAFYPLFALPVQSVKAMAFAADGKSLYVADSQDQLIRVNAPAGQVQAVIGQIREGSRRLDVDSMTFGEDGTLYAHDRLDRRLVDIDTATAVAGTRVNTPVDSISNTVHAIANDPVTDQIFVVENSYSLRDLGGNEASAKESAALMVLHGTSTAPASYTQMYQAQDLGRFLFGGVVTGRVFVSGSMELFYGGWIATGDVGGNGTGAIQFQDNFFIGGNLANLITMAAIGTDVFDQTPDQINALPGYVTGVDMHIGGTLGYVRTYNDIVANTTVDFNPTIPFNLPYIGEIEHRSNQQGVVPGTFFAQGLLGQDARFFNDTFDTPQYLGTLPIAPSDPNDPIASRFNIRVGGALNNVAPEDDLTDYYAVGLLAGQVVTVQLFNNSRPPLDVGVFDPDQRLIATDYANTAALTEGNQAFQFEADRPGVYRFAVGYAGDGGFVGAQPNPPNLGPGSYVLEIRNTGATGMGAMIADLNMYNPFGPADVLVRQGDVGTIRSLTTTVFGNTNSAGLVVANGNLRDLEGGATLGDPQFSINLVVPNGSVGLIRTPGSADFNLPNSPVRPVGFDYQMVDVGSMDSVSLLANRSIGVIRAGSITGGAFAVDADRSGYDGIIDLIDVTGDFRGPAISTGVGGNVRYIRVGGEVQRDPFFGVGLPQGITYGQGQTVQFTDDSGAIIQIVPQNLTPNPNFDPNNPTAGPEFLGPQVSSLIAYPIRGSGGAALISFDVNGPIEIVSQSQGLVPSAEIGRLTINGTPLGLTTDATTGKIIPVQPSFTPGAPLPLNLGFSGPAPIDVLELVSPSGIDNVDNRNGEIVSAQLGSVGNLSALNLGVGQSHTGTAILPASVVASAYPFVSQRTAITATNIAIASARQALGNFQVSGAIGDLVANADRNDNPAVYEGIVGPVVAGEMWDVQIGEGLASSGSGDVGLSGLYANGIIHNVRNQGLGSDVYGSIVALNQIQNITLNNGAMIGAHIMVPVSFADTRENVGAITFPVPGGIVGQRPANIQAINLNGPGAGMMSTYVAAGVLGDVSVGGFGIINSNVGVAGEGEMGRVVAGGYGIRGSFLGDGSNIAAVIANGGGGDAPATGFTPSVRQSELGLQFNPRTLRQTNNANDLHAYLGTSAAVPVVPGVTTTGVIEDTSITGTGNLGSVRAYQIRGVHPVPGTNPPIIMTTDINFGNSVGNLTTTSLINGLNLTTGRLGVFQPGSDVFRSNIVTSGPMKTLKIKGTLGDNSLVQAAGPSGRIDTVTIGGDLNGTIDSTGAIKKISVARDISGTIHVRNQVSKGSSLGSLFVGRRIGQGSLTIDGSVGNFETGGDFATTGDTLTVNGSIQKLKVRGNLGTNVHVTDTIGLLDVRGSILTGVTVQADNVFRRMMVAGDTQSGSLIRARELLSRRVRGADNATYEIG